MSDGRTCGWCSAPAVTEIITRAGKKNRKTAPVCEQHAGDFEARGMITVRTEVQERMDAERNRRAYLQRTRGWR